MIRKYKLRNPNKLRGALDERINMALDALADPHYVEEVIIEKKISHSKPAPHIELKRHPIKDGFFSVGVYARGGCGYLVKLAVRGTHGILNLPHYIRELDKRPDLYFAPA